MASKYARDRDREHRRDAARAASLDDEHGAYVAPPRTETSERHASSPIGTRGTLLLDIRLWFTGDGVVDFALAIEDLRFTAEQWTTVQLARVDTRHGHAHLHLLQGEPEQVVHIRRLDDTADVQAAYHEATDLLEALARRIDLDREGGPRV